MTPKQQFSRHLISDKHPVFEGHRKLGDDDIIQEGDETACVSCLLSYAGDTWTPAWPEVIGQTIEESLVGDMDARERVWRRK